MNKHLKRFLFYLFEKHHKKVFYLFGHPTNVSINKTAKIRISDGFSFNQFSSPECPCKNRYIGASFSMSDHSTLLVGNAHFLSGGRLSIKQDASFSIGQNVWFNDGFNIVVANNITIGNGCGFGPGLTMRDSDGHFLGGSSSNKPIVIGDHVWVGSNVTILKGVKIGSGAVVSANSFVNKDVPPNSLVGGAPAKIIRTNIEWN